MNSFHLNFTKQIKCLYPFSPGVERCGDKVGSSYGCVMWNCFLLELNVAAIAAAVADDVGGWVRLLDACKHLNMFTHQKHQ